MARFFPSPSLVAAHVLEGVEAETTFFLFLCGQFHKFQVGAPESENAEDAPEGEDDHDETELRNLGKPDPTHSSYAQGV